MITSPNLSFPVQTMYSISVDEKSRVSQSKFCCVSCSYHENADTNAAKNILAAGHAVLAGGAGPLGAAVKPEPLAA